jgi:predicted thioesterase
MDIQLPESLKLTREKFVEEHDTASSYGSGLIPVFATPAMVAFMEQTAQESLQPYLPEGYITLGTEINVKHKKATPVGKKVKCVSDLIMKEERSFTFSIKAWDDEGEIGEAVHKRYMVNAERFMQKLK